MPNSKPRKSRTYNTRLIKRNYSYYIDEICDLFGVHPNTVRSWIKDGLMPNDDSRPALVHGSTLKAFLTERQSVRKRACRPCQIYCCGCRTPRRVWDNLVDIEILTNGRLMLKAICARCERPINQFGSRSKQAEYEEHFDIQTITERSI